jgi:hypothetical protein
MLGHNERSILTKLKQQCGAQFTSKMEGMVTDLQLARDNQMAFETWMGEDEAERRPKVRRCRLPVSNPVLKVPVVSALETRRS